MSGAQLSNDVCQAPTISLICGNSMKCTRFKNWMLPFQRNTTGSSEFSLSNHLGNITGSEGFCRCKCQVVVSGEQMVSICRNIFYTLNCEFREEWQLYCRVQVWLGGPLAWAICEQRITQSCSARSHCMWQPLWVVWYSWKGRVLGSLLCKVVVQMRVFKVFFSKIPDSLAGTSFVFFHNKYDFSGIFLRVGIPSW